MQEKLKSWLRNDQVFYGLLLVLVGFGSFALGRLSVITGATTLGAGVAFIEAKASSMAGQASEASGGSLPVDPPAPIQESVQSTLSVVASKSGTKYHLINCAGAKQIKPENLLTFSNQEEAKRAGYTPAANCPGLQ